jgi:hypothetical protein
MVILLLLVLLSVHDANKETNKETKTQASTITIGCLIAAGGADVRNRRKGAVRCDVLSTIRR